MRNAFSEVSKIWYGVKIPWRKIVLIGVQHEASRTQYVEVENVKSNPLSIQCCVLQGSVLGPLLFLICINDIPNCLEKANIRTFADDTMHSILLFQLSTGP